MEKWVDKKFDFDFPVDKYPEFIERLRDTSPKLHFITHSTRIDFLTRKEGDHWSIQEIVGHLYTTDELFSGRIEDYSSRKETLRPAELSGAKTDQQNFNQIGMVILLKKFDERRSQYLTRLESLDPGLFARTARHPRLDVPMRLCDMLFFHAEHDAHHLNQINALIDRFELDE